MMEQNCYDCKHRGCLAGSAHSCCNHPDLGDVIDIQAVSDKFEIKAIYHGIKNGWFNWPWNFDPAWLQNCNAFEAKGGGGEKMKEVKGTRDFTGKTTHVLVQWEGKVGSMEFWKSYPSFSPLGVTEYTAERELSQEEVEAAVKEWEIGGGISFHELAGWREVEN